MINIFRTFNPLNIFWLAVLLFIMRAGYVLYAPEKVQLALAEPFVKSMLPVSYADTVSPGFSVLLAGIVVLGQALLLNYLINYYNLLGRPSFLPALMYIVLSGLFQHFLVLSPPLICNFFIIWLLFKLLDFYKAEDAKTTAYDVGMIAAAGTLIYLPFVYLMVCVWIALIIFRPFDWRDWAASLIGYATVFFFIAVFYYLNDRLNHFYQIWTPLGTPFTGIALLDKYDFLLLIPVIIIVILGLFKLQENFFKSYVLIRKTFQLLFFFFIIAAFSFYVRPAFGLSHFLICIVPVAVFFAYYFLYASKRWFYETLFFLLLIGIIYFQFNTF
ncbi:beta-carotene 15,15'-monooxygenase [Mucilaginibacter robiniae]|uniref:Beta-carotene 15,15'-monooxygenase n=1 Tax=Mucilaginibacter robiniae TaxID=2728022 RepID=A0A7L5E5Q5_9SPHI|nr:DUF6427 family protein [Mucilaginibacter robiniae]QJD95686.1 beta-carotene 15,15'-monooxygenase [Mucilaginibacter robiniae]